jgi:hypothetical protein
VKIRLGGRGSAIIVKVGEKAERHSLAELPAPTSLAVEDEMQAFQCQLELPFIARLLKITERLLFIAYSGMREQSEKEKLHSVLKIFARYKRENPRILREIGSRADQLAGHLHNAFTCLAGYKETGCEELRAFDEMRLCTQSGRDMRLSANEGRDRFQHLIELTSDILEQFGWPVKPDYDRIRKARKYNKIIAANAKNKYHGFHAAKKAKRAEKHGNCLAVMPLAFRDFCFTVAPVATALAGEGHNGADVWDAFEYLALFRHNNLDILMKSAERAAPIQAAVLDGSSRQGAILSLKAAIPYFQFASDAMQDLCEFCAAVENGTYLSFLPRCRVEAMLQQAQGRDEAERKKIYRSLPVMRTAFMSMTRMRAISKLCGAYCAAHEQELPEPYQATSKDTRRVKKLAAGLDTLLNETVFIALTRHKEFLKRYARVLRALAPALSEEHAETLEVLTGKRLDHLSIEKTGLSALPPIQPVPAAAFSGKAGAEYGSLP